MIRSFLIKAITVALGSAVGVQAVTDVIDHSLTLDNVSHLGLLILYGVLYNKISKVAVQVHMMYESDRKTEKQKGED